MKSKSISRPATCKLIEMLQDGAIDPRVVALEALSYMSEDDVADMAACAGFFECDEEDDDASESEESAADAAEDAAEYGARPKGAGPFGAMPMKGMRRVSISILMPMGKKPSPKA